MTDKTDRTARRRFNLLMFNLLTVAATAATCTPATTNDYFYTTPKTTNIFGRVMGENGDYRLVRQEDLCWLNEAWLERAALAGDNNAFDGDVVPAGTLVKHAATNSISTLDYWTRGTLREIAVPRNAGFDEMAWIASDGAMTNRWFRSMALPSHGLVKLDRMTNEFAELKAMRMMAWSNSPTNTLRHVKGYKHTWEDTDDDPSEGESYSATTNDYNVATLGIWVEAGNYRRKDYDSGGEYWRTVGWTDLGKEEILGKCVAPMRFGVQYTNAWLRGASSPRVVAASRLWGLVSLLYFESERIIRIRHGEGSTYYEDDVLNTNFYSHATALVDLGEPRWVGLEGGSLVYEAELDPNYILERATGMAPGMPSASEVLSTKVPAVQGEGGHYIAKSFTSSYVRPYLILDLRPLSWVNGW